ncbi:cuticle protein AMP4-like [Macrobrachium nipponense]|uniref:cuticle protein AMP4-like n=1 Tax=Macrobrachium nipponense TaxID=159736 RepID=UPI0030C7F3F7
MKFVVLACLAAVALAAPQQPSPAELRAVPIVREDRTDDGDGRFSYSFETGNGIAVSAEGTPGVEGQSNIAGTYRFPLGNNQFLEVTYVADENGYKPSTKFVASRK